MLDVVCENQIETAATDGFSTYGSELRQTCRKNVIGLDQDKQHPFYQTAQRYIDAHPLPYKDVLAKVDVYSVLLASDFIKYASAKYYEEFNGKPENVCRIARIKALYGEICGVLGTEEQMEQLNAMIKRGFKPVSAMNSFVQGIIDSVLYALASDYVFEMSESMIA